MKKTRGLVGVGVSSGWGVVFIDHNYALFMQLEYLHSFWRTQGNAPGPTVPGPSIGRTVPLLKPPQSPHCYLGAVDHAKNPPPDRQCAGNANSNVSFHINASFEQILFPWHTWARSKGLRTIGSDWPDKHDQDWSCSVARGGGKLFVWSTAPS